MLSSERIGELMFRHMRDELSPEEEAELSGWRQASPENEAFFKAETDPNNIRRDISEIYENKGLVSQRIRKKFPDFPVENDGPYLKEKRLIPVSFIIKFAAIFIATLIFAWMLLPRLFKIQSPPGSKHSFISKAIIRPGSNRATLKLSNGVVIALDSAGNGRIGNEGKTNIEKKDSGELVYSPSNSLITAEAGMNELVTPRGGVFSIVLSDGTKIWLNAASILRYPASFQGNDRTVELTGEAYFEVAKNPKAPFRVKSGNMEVEVLGTHFDLAAYPDEPVISTTLLEGSVEVEQNKNQITLKPGQQTQVSPEGTIQLITDADTRSITAWKDGKTSFKDASIQTIMRAVSRWYDVDVVFKGNIPDKKFKGGLPRNTDLSELLTVLEQSGIHFSMEGKTITVTP